MNPKQIERLKRQNKKLKRDCAECIAAADTAVEIARRTLLSAATARLTPDRLNVLLTRDELEGKAARGIPLSRGHVCWTDAPVINRWEVRIAPGQGSADDVFIVVEDINTGRTKRVRLSKRDLSKKRN